MKNKRFSMLEVDKISNDKITTNSNSNNNNKDTKNINKNEIKNNTKIATNIVIDEDEFKRNLQIHNYKRIQEDQRKEIEKTKAKLPDVNWAWLKIAIGSQAIILGLLFLYYRYIIGNVPRLLTFLIYLLTTAVISIFVYDKIKDRI